jgi:cell division protein FtsI (penicillin-binding protein 3)
VSEQAAFNWRPIIRRRIATGAVLFAVWALAIEARLVVLQVVRHHELIDRAERQSLRTIEAPAKRGELVDRNGRLLAYSVDADTIYAIPSEVTEPAKTIAALCGALGDCTPRERAAMAQRLARGKHFAFLRRQVSEAKAQAVQALNLDGVGFMKENRRFYPNRELAAHLLGYVGTDNVGLHGIEAAYDSLIRGKSGKVLVTIDARRRTFQREERKPTSGASIELTIDETLQHIVERELENGVIENRAAAGTAVVMDPQTGEVLAMANYPTFNPNLYNTATPERRRNRAVQELYEPGSTFKIVTASAALDEHLFTPTDIIDVSQGTIRFGARVVSDMHRYGPLSMTDVIVKSSNVGAIKMGLRLGPQRLGLYVQRFGFGRPSSPDFPGESPGIVWNPSKLTDSAVASVSMGYQVGVTPLQMAAAVSAVANGGTLYEPRVVRAVVRDGVRIPVPAKTVRRAITEDTAAKVRDMMEAVVLRGTATAAKVPGYAVAGKTGTAAKLVGGRYSKSEYNASFVGFVPAREPVFTVIVVIDSPHARGYTGGVVAAPVFQRIAEAALRLQGVPPTIDAAEPVHVERPRPGIVDVVDRHPQPAPVLVPAVASETAVVPDVRGLSARAAVTTLSRLGLTVRMQGDGMVVDQLPAANSPLEAGAVATLLLGRDPARPPALLAGASQ